MKQLRYWDSSCFLGWFNEEPDKAPKLEPVIKLAEKGDIVIVASTITLVEVFRMKKRPRIQEVDEDIIQAFFDNPFISLRDVSPIIGVKARKLLLKYDWLKPYDATHAATALHYSVDNMDVFDSDLLKLNGVPEFASIEVSVPNVPIQLELGQDSETQKT